MKHFIHTSLILLSFALSGFAQQQEPPAAEPAQQDIPALLKELGSDQYPTRQNAYNQLWQLGTKALPSLQKLTTHPDPEIRSRATKLTLYISSGILPDTPENIRQLVIDYARGTSTEKRSIIRKLIELKQWRQVIHLARTEKNPTTRKSYESSLRRASLAAVRETITANKIDDALALLEFLGSDSRYLNMRAWIHHCQGNIPQELAKAAKQQGKQAAAWRLALHRVSGNYPAAIREAELAGLHREADHLRILTGDIQPTLKRVIQSQASDTFLRLGTQLQLARIQGNKKTADKLARQIYQLARGKERAAAACKNLALNGYRQQALSILTSFHPFTAANYFDSLEDESKLFRTLGISAEAKPPFASWTKKQVALAVDDDSDAIDRLLLLAGWFNQHGYREHAIAVVDPLMTALHKDGADRWFTLLPDLGQIDLGEYVLEIVRKRGNDDGETDIAFKQLFTLSTVISTDHASHIWAAVKKRNTIVNDGKPTIDLAQSMRDMAFLSGLIPDPERKSAALHLALYQEVANKANTAKETRYRALYSYARLRNNMTLAASLSLDLAKLNPRWKEAPIYFSHLFNDWKNTKAQVQQKAQEDSSSYSSQLLWYYCQKSLGDHKGASKSLQRAKLLTLGDPTSLASMSDNLERGGFEKQAFNARIAAFALTSPDSENLPYLTSLLSRQSGIAYREGQWKLAAAINEYYILINIQGSSDNFRYFPNYLRTYFQARFSSAMHTLTSTNKKRGIQQLDQLIKNIPGDANLADEFFPLTRAAKVGEIYNKWFALSYKPLADACQRHPNAHNTHNSAAWLASRAARQLDAALEHSRTALKIRPHQAAYIDTMAEVWFAKNDRPKALQWSEKSLTAAATQCQTFHRSESNNADSYRSLTGQYRHFKNDPIIP